MCNCEWIIEVKDWEEKTQKFTEGHHECDSEWGTLCCEDEYRVYTDTSKGIDKNKQTLLHCTKKF